MKFVRHFTSSDRPVAEQIEWEVREASIPGAGFAMSVEVPRTWSQDATNVFAQKYLRKAGVPDKVSYHRDGQDEDEHWAHRYVAHANATYGSETSARQVFHRMAGCWTYWGWREGYFGATGRRTLEKILLQDPLSQDIARVIERPGEKSIAEESADIFYDEVYWMLAHQLAAPNSPQWFNTGLWWAYGIKGEDSGQWAFLADSNERTGARERAAAEERTDESERADASQFYRTENSYEHPQVHACYIQPVVDTLVGDGGMLDLWAKEARLFKHGSGTGTNLSTIRAKGEPLSGGGISSGLMSFLRVGDSNAGSIKSGGVTRRAAKMVVLDLDHPEIEAFVDWKVREEAKAAAMHVGSKVIQSHGGGSLGLIPNAVLDRLRNGFEPEVFAIDGMEAEAIASVDGQNSNNSVRVTHHYMDLSTRHNLWPLVRRTDGGLHKSVYSDELWLKICRAAWACGDPGLQFSDTINAWHTCPTDGEIKASNPCSEYLFLDNTACNLASLNLCKFYGKRASGGTISIKSVGKEFDCDAFEHAVRLWTTVLDISVSMASYPSREIAEGSYNYRTLGLGYANLGGLLARMGLRYDSDDGRALAAGITALMTGAAYRTSAEIAAELGPFPRWEANAGSMMRILRNHALTLRREPRADWYEGLNILPVLHRPLDETNPRNGTLWHTVDRVWNEVLSSNSFRNAQVTLLAPTGTISLVMDCETSGVEPFYSQRSTKQLAGGGTMEFTNDVDTQDCAVPSEPGGPCLEPMAHVRMVAAVQPFLSGGVSKTVNLPHSATVEDVDRIYREAHQLGLKSIALYRDGSKLTQPLAAGTEKKYDGKSHVERIQEETERAQQASQNLIDKWELLRSAESTLKRGQRRELPSLRPSASRTKLEVAGHSVYLSTGDHVDGELAEIFLGIGKRGSDVGSWADCFCKAVSIGLQYGVPLDAFVHAFEGVRFEPAGMVAGETRVRFCKSLPDLVFRHLAVERLGREELASVPRAGDAETVAQAAAEIAPVLARATHSTPPVVMVADVCPDCGTFGRLRRTGTCLTCSACGYNEGCG